MASSRRNQEDDPFAQIHRSAIHVTRIEESLPFWRDLDVLTGATP